MKGVIVNCLGDLVKEKFGTQIWYDTLEATGLNKMTTFLATEDVDDGVVLALINNLCKKLNISLQEAADAFGEYWVCTFAPKVYRVYYTGVESAREFLLKMDHIHRITTQNIPNARPPRFEYQWNDDRTLIMKYISDRGLIDLMIGLIKGVGKYYNENLLVTRLNNNTVKIVFPG